MIQKRHLTIHFMDGTNIAYDFPQRHEDISTMSSKIEELLDKQFIVIEGDGTVNFYPVNNIKSIQVYPVPEKLPDFVILGAEVAETF